MVGFLLLVCFLVGLLGFSPFGKQQNIEIYQTIKGFNFNVHSSSIHMLYLRGVGGMGEIIFKKMECLTFADKEEHGVYGLKWFMRSMLKGDSRWKKKNRQKPSSVHSLLESASLVEMYMCIFFFRKFNIEC